MHQLEKQAMDDPFLWEALEGYANTVDPGAGLSILQRQLHERIVHLQENKKVFDLTWQRLSIATAAAVLFVSAGILFWMNSNNSASKPASNQVQVEVYVIDRDSLSSGALSTGSSADHVDAVLSEVIVSGSGVQPLAGWDIYRQYLENNIHRPKNKPIVKGTVFLSFEVNADGRPVNIHILNSLTKACDAEAIRLIKNGSAWKVPTGSKIRTGMIEVKF